MEQILRDLRYGVRLLARSPGFAAIVVVTLALGIGANTVIFSLVNALLIRPLPVAEPERLVSVFTSYTGGNRHGITSYPDYEDLRDRNEVLSGLAAQNYSPMGLGGADQPEVVMGQLVSWNYFSVLGVDAHLGRTFLAEEEETPGTHPVAVLSHRIWKRRFGSDPEITGTKVLINDHPFTVVGVAPRGFAGTSVLVTPDVWVPLMMVDRAFPYAVGLDGRVDPWLFLIGRLKPGVSLEQARASLEVLAANLEQQYPDQNAGKGVTVVEADRTRIIPDGTTDVAERLTAIVMGVVGLVLLIACFNVAGLQLVRAVERQREVALRFSLGASRGRIVRQLLFESAVLSTVAGAIGLLIATWAVGLLSALQLPTGFPVEMDLRLDRTVLAFTALLSILTGVLFGLAPAILAVRRRQLASLGDQSRSVTQSRGRARLQSALVISQVALSLVLLISAGLFLRSLGNTLAVDPGFGLRNGLVLPVNLGFSQYDEARGRAFHRQLVDRIRSLPGVRTATLAAFLPLGMNHGHHDVRIEGYEPRPGESMLVKRNMVGPGFFETMGIPIVKGRAITEQDKADGEPVAVINETLARRYWPDADPLGRTIRADLGTPRVVVGVMKDGKYGALDEESQPYLCIPLEQAEYQKRFHVVLEAAGDPQALIQPVLHEVRQLSPNLPVSTIATVTQHLGLSVGSARALAALVGGFGLLALLLALVGVYGVMSYSVARRTHEFGIRVALGARGSAIVGMVLSQGLRMTVIGVAAGLLLALGVTRVLSGFLHEVSPLDPVVFAAVSLALAATALLACFIPARRAASVDPTTALRAE
jgi:predicted permease